MFVLSTGLPGSYKKLGEMFFILRKHSSRSQPSAANFSHGDVSCRLFDSAHYFLACRA